MHICMDARPAVLYKYTGIGTYTENLINSLVEIDKQNIYTLFWNNNEIPKPFFRKNIHIQLFPKNAKEISDQVYIPKLLKHFQPDVYHIPQNGLDMPLNTSTKCIVTVHDIIPVIDPESCGVSYYEKFAERLPQVLEQSNHIITVSNASKNDIIEHYHIDPSKITVIYEGKNKIYKPLNPSRVKQYLKQKYHLSESYILYIGGFNKRKNVKNLLYAFEKFVKKSSSSLKLVLLGNGKEVESLKKMCADLKIEKQVIFTGFVPDSDLPIFYSGALFFLYPSYYEGFGLPPLEAMSCGTPVITSCYTSLPEIVGDAAVCIDTKQVALFSEHIERLYYDDDLRKKLAKKGLKQAMKFDWKDCARETLKIYQKIDSGS